MLDTVRRGLDCIIKMCVCQLAMTMFGTMLALATRQNNTLLLAASFLSIFLYLFVIYIHVWELGASDRIKVDGGRLERKPLTGLVLSLIANSINILLAIGRTIGYFFYDISNNTPLWAGELFGITNALARLIQGMYTGIIQQFSPADFPSYTRPDIFFYIIIPAILISTFAYWMGLNNKRILALVGIDISRNSKK